MSNLSGGDVLEKVSIRVIEVIGRTVDLKNNLSSNSNLVLRSFYQPGIYFAEIIQGSVHKQIKLVKL